MIFRNYSKFSSEKSADEIRALLLGQHLQVHDVDFEIYQKGEEIKIIPHAEIENHIYTLPITRLKFSSNGGKTSISSMSKPRRIDIGGPYILLIFIAFAIIASILLLVLGNNGEYDFTAKILGGIGVAALLLLVFRLQVGYYDYVRKINKWVKNHV